MAFATIDVTKGITGTLPTANGGTGATSFSPGKIAQVTVGSTNTTKTVSNDNGWYDTNLTGSITPSASDSKVLVTVSQYLYCNESIQADARWGVKIFRDSTQIYIVNPDSASLGLYDDNGGSSSSKIMGQMFNFTYLDSPSSTSALTYKTQMRATSSSLNGWNAQGGGFYSYITMMEILA
tara:strand:+ start:26 stop:565 length:540 start_codon:yes stop_codon:yes gene_type:complete